MRVFSPSLALLALGSGKKLPGHSRTKAGRSLFFVTVQIAAISVLVLFTGLGAADAESVVEQRSTTACQAQFDPRVEADIRSAISPENSANLRRSVDTLIADRAAIAGGCASRASLSTQIAILQYRLGDLASAEKTISESLEEESLAHRERSEGAALNHYMLAGVYKVRGAFRQAEAEYTKAAEIFSNLQPGKPRALARVYGDMAAMYADRGDMRSAEAAMQKSLASENAGAGGTAGSVGTRDALVHLAYRRGHLSEALDLLHSMIQDFGENQTISRELRAHMYRDEGELLVAARRPDEAPEPLRKSLSLTDPGTKTPDYAIALAMLSQAYELQKNWPQAEASLQEASKRSAVFETDFPQDAGKILASYGILLSARKRWSDARPVLLHAASLSETDRNVESAVLQSLIQADHHLHERGEERAMKEKLKTLGSGPADPARENTIDVLAFNGGSR